jgi:hypothetical protein
MSTFKFEEMLHIGKTVWYKSEEYTITGINKSVSGKTTCVLNYVVKEIEIDKLSLIPPAQKKKIKLYRYTFKYSFCGKTDNINYVQSEWTAFDEKQYIRSRDKTLVKIEEKEIEVEE